MLRVTDGFRLYIFFSWFFLFFSIFLRFLPLSWLFLNVFCHSLFPRFYGKMLVSMTAAAALDILILLLRRYNQCDLVFHFIFFSVQMMIGHLVVVSFCFVSEYINGKYFRIEAIFCVTKEKQKSTTNGDQASAFQCCIAWVACPKYEQSAWKPFKLSSMYKVYKHCNRLIHPKQAILRSKVSTSIFVDLFSSVFFFIQNCWNFQRIRWYERSTFSYVTHTSCQSTFIWWIPKWCSNKCNRRDDVKMCCTFRIIIIVFENQAQQNEE